MITDRGTGTPRVRARTPWFVLLALVTLCLMLFKLGDAPIRRHSEARVHAVSRTMVQSGDYLVPYLDGAPRLQKPPLYYWATSLASIGEDDVSHFRLRLTSALSSVLLLLLVRRWGASALGPAGGILAASVLLLMDQFWTNGRRGDAEMLLTLCCTAALLCFDRMYFDARRRLLPWFALLCTLSFLAKATVALLVIGLPIAVWISIERRWSAVFRRDVLLWMGAAAGASLSWYVATLIFVPGALEKFRSALLIPVGSHSLESDAAHYRPFYFFFLELPQVLGAALLLLPCVLLRAGRLLRSDEPRIRFLFLSCVELFLAFTLLPAKQAHYLLPILPMLAIVMAESFSGLVREHLPPARLWLQRYAFVWLVAGSVATLLCSAYLAFPLGERLLCWSAAAVAGGTLTIAGFRAAKAARLKLLGSVAMALWLFLIVPVMLSVELWQDRFATGAAKECADFHEQRWTGLFETLPFLRTTMHFQHPSAQKGQETGAVPR